MQQTVDLCFLWKCSLPTFPFHSEKAACCSVLSFCTFKFSKNESPRTPCLSPIFLSSSHWCVRLHNIIAVMAEHKRVHKFNQSGGFGRLYSCCISPTQVFNKMIWFILLEVNNFTHESAAWCVTWETLSEVTSLQIDDIMITKSFYGHNRWVWAVC